MNSGLLNALGDPDDPRTQGLLGTFLSMLAASGPSKERRTFGQIAGASGLEGMKQYDQARLLKQRDEESKRRNMLTDLQLMKIKEQIDDENRVQTLLRDPSFFSKQKQSMQVGTDVSSTGPELVTEQVPLDPREQAMKFISSGSPLLAKQGLATLAAQKEGDDLMNLGGGVIYDRRLKQFLTAPQKPADEWEELPGRTPGGQMMQRNKRTGEIKPIGSGPPQPNAILIQREADSKEGRANVSETVMNIRGAFEALDAAGGVVKSDQSPMQNAANMALSTTPGGYVGRVLTPQAQMWRDYINTQRPALINEIRRSTGMSAKNMDSNRELQFYIAMVGDTGVDIEVNKAALEAIDSRFGTKFGVTSSPEGRAKLQSLMGGKSNPIGPQGGLKRGHRDGDYVYLGGDPKDPNSWAKTP